jgi:hypothetical protein
MNGGVSEWPGPELTGMKGRPERGGGLLESTGHDSPVLVLIHWRDSAILVILARSRLLTAHSRQKDQIQHRGIHTPFSTLDPALWLCDLFLVDSI